MWMCVVPPPTFRSCSFSCLVGGGAPLDGLKGGIGAGRRASSNSGRLVLQERRDRTRTSLMRGAQSQVGYGGGGVLLAYTG